MTTPDPIKVPDYQAYVEAQGLGGPNALHKAADESNDTWDHDELHAAAEVTKILTGQPFEAHYVYRWLNQLLLRVERDAKSAEEESFVRHPETAERLEGLSKEFGEP
jgi:hypothetical protein